MAIFTSEICSDFNTLTPVGKLLRNGKALVDEFWEEIRRDKNLAPELGDLYSIIEQVANRQLLPNTKYRKWTVGKTKYSLGEAKSKNLRLYVFKEPELGLLFIIGGKKTSQDKDIGRAEGIIKEYSQHK